MKALVLERRGKKAILLLPGGEMRTVRAKKEWQTGMEVAVRPYPIRKPRMKVSPRAALYPMTACTAILLILFIGFRLTSGSHIDRQHPIQPLSSGMPTVTQTETPIPTETPARTDAPTASPQPTPTAAPIPAASADNIQMVHPTPNTGIKCDECGEFGHDDDDCPYEICDECGQKGHDDDDCPNQICDECGQRGHDDDDCPDGICDECGQKGHDDDDCPYERDDD